MFSKIQRNSNIYLALLLVFLTQCTSFKSLDNKYKNAKVALVLGGGGSKGYAHLGAIEVLEENNIPIDFIVGTSIGSAVGAIYADTRDIKKTKEIFFKAKSYELLDFSLNGSLNFFSSLSSPIRGNSYEKFIESNLSVKSFNDLKIPLLVVAVDSISGQKYVIKEGSIAKAVRASSAIPPIFKPVEIDGKILICRKF
ncbi:MAG: patatin-like phospholipase family protein, partial [Pseudomonadota bacterium]